VTLELSVTERNFLGRGQYVRAAVGGGLDENRTFDFSFTEPYFLGRRWRLVLTFIAASQGTPMIRVYTTVANGGACGSSRRSPMICSSGCPTPLIARL
jgi:outer membrane protein insertion porin family